MVRQVPLYLAGVALVCASIFDAGGQAYFALPMVLTILAVVLNWDSIVQARLGSKWMWIPLLLIWLSSWIGVALHANFLGVAFCTWFVSLYFLGRGVGAKTLAVVPYGAALASVFIIFSKVTIYTMSKAGYEFHSEIAARFWMTHHLAAFLILAGMLLVRDKRWCLLFVPAVVLTGSEEGLVGLLLLGLVWLYRLARKNAQNRATVPLVLGIALVAVVVGSGYASAAYPRLNGERFSTLDTALNKRVEPVEQLVDSGEFWLGSGFQWVTIGNTEDGVIGTVHNVPLKIASQMGVVAGLAWLFLMAWGFLKTRYRWLFALMLWYGMIDHSLWTEMAVWSPIVLGIAVKEAEHGEC